MAGNYDATTKYLVEMAPQDWLALCGHHIDTAVRVVDADLSTITMLADKILVIEDSDPWIAHFEFQSSYESGIGLRLLRYNVLIEYRHQLPVQSILVLLKRESDGPAANGITRRSLPDGTCYYEFRFLTVRVWQLPVEDLLSGKIGTLALAPISDVAEIQLPSLIRRMTSRVDSEIPREKRSEFWTSSAILMGARYPALFIEALLRGVFNMRESSVIQAFLQEGREEGREEGRATEAKRILLEIVKDRFESFDPTLHRDVEAISDVDRLEKLILRAGKIGKWEDLLA